MPGESYAKLDECSRYVVSLNDRLKRVKNEHHRGNGDQEQNGQRTVTEH